MISVTSKGVSLTAFASESGANEEPVESIPGFAEQVAAQGLSRCWPEMRCRGFHPFTSLLEEHVLRCVEKTLQMSGVAPEAVDALVVGTMNRNAGRVTEALSRVDLGQSGLINCVPICVSLTQCVSSLVALQYAVGLFSDLRIQHVLLVAVDFMIGDDPRIQKFALFGDAVTSCLLRRGMTVGFSLVSLGLGIDTEGLCGRDNFASRQRVAVTTVNRVLNQAQLDREAIQVCFSINVYQPLLQYYADLIGVSRQRMFVGTRERFAHCGNCDWMLNVRAFLDTQRSEQGAHVLIQSHAPGYFGCGVLRYQGD